MHSKIIILLLFVCIEIEVSAQSNVYHPFPLAQNTEWRSDYYYWGGCNSFNSYALCSSVRYFTNGDTMVGGVVYYKIYRDAITYGYDTFYVDNNSLYALIREDTVNKNLYFSNDFYTDELFYDFGLNVGDTGNSSLTYGFEVISIDSINVSGNYHRKINFEDIWSSPVYIIEGIGADGGLFYHSFGMGANWKFRCFTVDGIVLLEDTLYSPTECFLAPISGIYPFNNSLSVFMHPNPIGLTQSLTIDIPYNTFCEASFYDVLGKEVYSSDGYGKQTLEISKYFFSKGIYVVRLCLDKESCLTRQLIVD